MIAKGLSLKTKILFVCFLFIQLLSQASLLVKGQNDYEDYEYSEDYFESSSHRKKYNGKYVGKLNSYHHQVNGQLYAVNEKTLLLKGFQYDGQGRDAFFYGGGTGRPGPLGFIIPNEYYRSNVLERYLNADFTLMLPPSRKVSDLSWFSVFDIDENSVYGDIFFPEGFEPPTHQYLQPLEGFSNGVGAQEVTVMDSKTIHLKGFTYDGLGGDGVFFWVGHGPQPSSKGIKVPDELGYLEPLNTYGREVGRQEVRLKLPGNLTVFDIRWFSVYDTKRNYNLGHVIIPEDLNVPPALVEIFESARDTTMPNCEMLHSNLRVAWSVFAPSITIELAGNLKNDNEYMSFGISGKQGTSEMIGSDVAVAYRNGFLAHVDDYNITAKCMCTEALGFKKGVCQDVHTGGTQNNQIQSYTDKSGIFRVVYRRQLDNSQDPGDNPIEGLSSVVWAMGQLGSGSLGGKHIKGRPAQPKREPTFHHTYPRSHVAIDFTRKESANNCWAFVKDKLANKMSKLPSNVKSELKNILTEKSPWKKIRLFDPTLRKFEARLGPSGGFSRGYSAVTGLPSVGRAWYINGYLTPELYLQRGLDYTFTVEGGDEPYSPEYYHPFVISNDPLGGYWRLPMDGSKRTNVKIYAGVKYTYRGKPRASATGRLCLWSHSTKADPRLDDNFNTFERFRNSLHLDCKRDKEHAVLMVRPNMSWPDVVYYQSFTSPYMGWKINILDDFSKRYLQNENSASIRLSYDGSFISTLICAITLVRLGHGYFLM